jgi:hypothetical protein
VEFGRKDAGGDAAVVGFCTGWFAARRRFDDLRVDGGGVVPLSCLLCPWIFDAKPLMMVGVEEGFRGHVNGCKYELEYLDD